MRRADRKPESGYAGNLARILAEQGRNEEAEKAFRLAIADEPENVEWYAGLAQVLLKLDRQEEAIPPLVEATNLDQRRGDLYNELGMIEMHPLHAEEAFRSAIRADPENPIYRANLAVCLIDQWRLDDAEDCLIEAIRIDPADLSYPTDLGHLLIDMGRIAEAEGMFRRTLWSVNHNAIIDGPAWELYNEARFQEADEQFARRKQTTDDDHLAWCYRGMGTALLAMGQDREAIVAFRGAISIRPQEPQFHTELANALRVGGRERLAIRALQRAEELKRRQRKGRRPTTRRPVTLGR